MSQIKKNKYKFFIDESCHLEHDGIPVMCIGYIKVKDEDYYKLSNSINNLKRRFKTPSELKWNKVSATRIPLYFSLIDFFFDNPLDFRCILIKYKERLNHADFNQGDHNNFYYKMIYYLLRPNIPDDNKVKNDFVVYLDIKDTRGKERLIKIHQVFENYCKGESPFINFQHIQSYESVFIQLVDFFIGAITYKNRVDLGVLKKNPVREYIIEYLEKKSGYHLTMSTVPWETKFNIFNHQPKRTE